jgi:hypothetical protein
VIPILYEIYNYTTQFAEKLNSKIFITFHIRPKFVSENHQPLIPFPAKDFAIVIQGPINEEHDFTIESIRLLRRFYPDLLIIVSTWQGEESKLAKITPDANMEFLFNELPKPLGLKNINAQIKSTLVGLNKATSLGKVFAMKLRTDQRIYSANCLQTLLELLKAFPPTGSFTRKLRGRILIFGRSLTYRLYGCSDMLHFGYTEDLLNFWSAAFDLRDPGQLLRDAAKCNMRDQSKLKMCEVYVNTSFFERMGVTLDWTLSQHFGLIKDLYILLDFSILDVFWPKYKRYSEIRTRSTHYSSNRVDDEMSFGDWLSLHNGSTEKIETYHQKFLEQI